MDLFSEVLGFEVTPIPEQYTFVLPEDIHEILQDIAEKVNKKIQTNLEIILSERVKKQAFKNTKIMLDYMFRRLTIDKKSSIFERPEIIISNFKRVDEITISFDRNFLYGSDISTINFNDNLLEVLKHIFETGYYYSILSSRDKEI